MKHIITKLFEDEENVLHFLIKDYQYFLKYENDKETYEYIMQFEKLGIKYELYRLAIHNSQTSKYYEYCIIVWGGQKELSYSVFYLLTYIPFHPNRFLLKSNC